MRIHDAYTRMDRLDRTTGAGARAGVGKGPKAEDAVPASAGAPSSATMVTLSAKAQELSARAGAGKIDALRHQVQSGSLKIDAHAIASKLTGGDEP